MKRGTRAKPCLFLLSQLHRAGGAELWALTVLVGSVLQWQGQHVESGRTRKQGRALGILCCKAGRPASQGLCAITC